MDKRKKMRERLYEIRDEEDRLDMELDEHDKEMDALQPKIDGIEEEIMQKQFEEVKVKQNYKDGSEYRREAKEREHEEKVK